nr:unnamed protein product [Spirometra erinaceieuropaei]
MENVSKALAVLKERNIHLENIGASDIVDGNANLILGLIWTIMLHFQVHVHNFTTDWTDGLSICALLHRHRPDLLDFNTLLSESPLSRITTAFTVAASGLRIPVLVEPQEFIACCCCCDERCVIAVIATWYQFLNQDRAAKKSGDRLSSVLARALDVNRKLAAYLCRVARAKAWLKKNQEFLNRQIEILTSPRQRNGHAGADDSLRRLRQWYAEEKRPQIDNMNQIEDTWLTLRTEQMASGYHQLMPPQGYCIADLQTAWHQIDTAEGTLRALIQETLRERATKERLLATFHRKVGLHRRWLAENAKLALMLCMADRTNLTCTLLKLSSLHNWGTDSNLLSFLLSEREKFLAQQCKHKTLMADADAHNSQRIRGLQELRRQICRLEAEGDQSEESLSRLRRSWTNLSTVLSRRTEFIESSVDMVESIIDVEKVIMQLEVSWDRLSARLLQAVDFELQLTEGEKLTLDRMTSGSWQREQRQYLQALTRMTELTFGELQNDNLESIRIISSKFRLIENEIHNQVGKETTFTDCPFCTKVAPETRHPAPLLVSQTAKESFEDAEFNENIRWIGRWRGRRTLSLGTLTNIVGQERARLRRTMTLERLHEPCVLPEEVSQKQTFLRRIKKLATESLNSCRRSFHETHLLLMTETAVFLREIEQYKAFKSVFLELTEVRIELDEGKAWVCQTTDYFSQTQLPAFRLALARCDGSPSDGSLEAAGDMIGWWKRLLQTNKLLKTIILYQSTVRRHQQVNT